MQLLKKGQSITSYGGSSFLHLIELIELITNKIGFYAKQLM